jgi:outer membrane protein TolC
MRQILRLPTPLLLLLLATYSLSAQTLDWSAVQQQVLEYHPLAKQSGLLREQAAAMLLRARGGFDPKAFGAYSNKNFNGKNYFQYVETGVKLPTWAGLEIKSAYNYAAGDFLNAESKLPKNGQTTIGFDWSLGQGLLFDERRAGLQMARISLEMSESERRALLNDLLLESAKTYWDWVLAQQSLQITEDALLQAKIRHNGLTESFRQGDKPAIDTLESFILVQSRTLDLQFARTEAQNAAIALTVFLWNADNQIMTPETLPAVPAIMLMNTGMEAVLEVDDLVQQAQLRHPEIQLYQAKLRQLATERRLKNEKRKPVVNLSYYLLGNGWSFFPSASARGVEVLANDIKWGLDVSYPLLNRKARGDYQLTQIKLAQTELELQLKIQGVESKVRQYANDLQNLRAQVVLFRDMTDNFRRLLAAENEKFLQGESSIFLINTREQRWLDTQLKLLKLLTTLQKTEAGLKWAVGVLAY